MKYRALGDRVIVKRQPEETVTKGGIIIPDTVQEKPLQGTVVGIGGGRILDNGQVGRLEVKPNDVVLFGKYSGTEVRIDGEDYLILREDDLLGVL